MIRNIPKYNGAGVYSIINKEEKKVYIGISNNIRNRILKHNSNIIKAYGKNKRKKHPKSFQIITNCNYLLYMV